MWETQVQSLSQEDPLEKEMATHSRSLAWRIPWTEEPGGLQSLGLQRVGHELATSLHFTSLLFILFIIAKASDKELCDFSSLLDLEHFAFFRTEIKISNVQRSGPLTGQ